MGGVSVVAALGMAVGHVGAVAALGMVVRHVGAADALGMAVGHVGAAAALGMAVGHVGAAEPLVESVGGAPTKMNTGTTAAAAAVAGEQELGLVFEQLLQLRRGAQWFGLWKKHCGLLEKTV